MCLGDRSFTPVNSSVTLPCRCCISPPPAQKILLVSLGSMMCSIRKAFAVRAGSIRQRYSSSSSLYCSAFRPSFSASLSSCRYPTSIPLSNGKDRQLPEGQATLKTESQESSHHASSHPADRTSDGGKDGCRGRVGCHNQLDTPSHSYASFSNYTDSIAS